MKLLGRLWPSSFTHPAAWSDWGMDRVVRPVLRWAMRGERPALALCVLLLLSGCGSGDDSSLAPAPTTSVSSPTDTTSSSSTGPARIPETFGPPERLAAGTYLTPAGFAPELTVQVPAGWWGGGGADGWVVGQGNDPARETFTGPSVWVDVVPMRWPHAVAAFSNVKGVRYASPPQPSTFDGHHAMTFRAKPRGREAVLLDDALGVGVDLPPASDRQLLVEVGQVTLLFRIEKDAPAIDEVLRTVTFT